MRKLFAAVAAIAMIVGGFAVWKSRGDSSTTNAGGSPRADANALKRLWCVPEAELACQQLPNRTVTVLTPAALEKLIISAGPSSDGLDVDGIVASSQWLQRWVPISAKLRLEKTPLATTELVAVVEKSGSSDGRSCAGQMLCLLKLGARLSLPSLDVSSAGTMAAATALKASGVTSPDDDSAANVVASLSAMRTILKKPRTSREALVALTQIHLLDAAVMTSAEFTASGVANGEAIPVSPAASITLSLGYIGEGTSTGNLHDQLAALLLRFGWSPPTIPSSELDSEFLNQTYKALR